MIDFAELKRTFRGALLLEEPTFEALADAPDGVARGLKFLVTVALAVGLVVSLVSFVQAVTTSPAQEIDQAMNGVSQVFDQLQGAGVFGDPKSSQAVLDNVKAGMAMGKQIAGVVEQTTPAPMSAVALFEALGKWLSWPFSWIALWLLWGVLTLLFARMLGGTATIQRMLAVTSLVAAPHVLDVFGWVACAGPLIGLLAWLWGVVVYVKATAVANRTGVGVALLAVALPVLIPLVLALALLLFVGLLSGLSSR
jgi:hypothetical protein